MKTTKTNQSFDTQSSASKSGLRGHLIYRPSHVFDWLPDGTDTTGMRRVSGDGYAYWVSPAYYRIEDLSGSTDWTVIRDAGHLIGWVEDGKLTPINAR